MGRPGYETKKQLRREERVRRFLDQSTEQYSIMKMPQHLVLDWAFFEKPNLGPNSNNTVLYCFAEFKNRNHALGHYDSGFGYESTFISIRKILFGSFMARVFDVPFFVYVQFVDGLYRQEIKDLNEIYEYDCSPGGRYDRSDDDDYEPVVHLRDDLFSLVVERNIAVPDSRKEESQ